MFLEIGTDVLENLLVEGYEGLEPDVVLSDLALDLLKELLQQIDNGNVSILVVDDSQNVQLVVLAHNLHDRLILKCVTMRSLQTADDHHDLLSVEAQREAVVVHEKLRGIPT